MNGATAVFARLALLGALALTVEGFNVMSGGDLYLAAVSRLAQAPPEGGGLPPPEGTGSGSFAPGGSFSPSSGSGGGSFGSPQGPAQGTVGFGGGSFGGPGSGGFGQPGGPSNFGDGSSGEGFGPSRGQFGPGSGGSVQPNQGDFNQPSGFGGQSGQNQFNQQQGQQQPDGFFRSEPSGSERSQSTQRPGGGFFNQQQNNQPQNGSTFGGSRNSQSQGGFFAPEQPQGGFEQRVEFNPLDDDESGEKEFDFEAAERERISREFPQIKKERDQFAKTIQRLEKAVAAKSLKSTGLNMSGIIADLKENLQAVNEEIDNEDVESARGALQYFHQEVNPNAMMSVVTQIPGVLSAAKRFARKNPDASAKLRSLAQEMVAALNGGDVDTAGDVVDETRGLIRELEQSQQSRQRR